MVSAPPRSALPTTRPASLRGNLLGGDKCDIAVEDRLGDFKETRHGVGPVVAIHRRLVGKTLIGGKYTQVGRVLRDKKADGAWFVDTHVIGHMEQHPPHRGFVSLFRPYDRRDRHHRSPRSSGAKLDAFGPISH